MTRKKTGKKIMSCFLAVAIAVSMMCGLFVVQAGAFVSVSDKFYKVSLTGNGAVDMVNVAVAQTGRKDDDEGWYPGDEAWCADFVLDCTKVAGQTAAIPVDPKNANCGTFLESLRKMGYEIQQTAQAGDLVFYRCPEDGGIKHVAIMKDATTSVQGNLRINGVYQVVDDYPVDSYRDSHGHKCEALFIRPAYSGSEYTDNSEKGAAATRDQAVAWVKSKIGQRIDVDGYYGSQCKDLVAAYASELFGVTLKGDAKDLITCAIPSTWQRIKNYAEFLPEPGDIAIWDACEGNGWCGHTGVVTSANLNTFISVDQNWYNFNLYEGSAAASVEHDYISLNFWGFLRPAYGNQNPDIENPTVTNALVETSNTSSLGFVIACNASDDVGIDKVILYVWNSVNRSKENAQEYTCNYEVNYKKAWQYVDLSPFNYVAGTYYVNIWAYDKSGKGGDYKNGPLTINITEDNLKSVSSATIKDGTYCLVNGLGYAMDVQYGDGQGNRIWTYTPNSTAAQQFRFEHRGDGKYLIHSVLSSSGRVVDVNRGGDNLTDPFKAGNAIDIWTNNDWPAQLFYVVPTGDGSYALELVDKDNYVIGTKHATAAGDYNNPNSNLYLQRFVKNSPGQRWYFRDTSGNAIDPKISTNISSCTISDIPAQTYTGSAITPTVTVKDGSKTLVKDTDYTVSYSSNNVNVGTVTVTVTGKGNYAGTIQKTFKINQRNLSDCKRTYFTDTSYTGSAIEEPVTINYGSKVLTNNTDYTVSYTPNINVGIVYVTITGKGNFTGTMSGSYQITAKNLSNFTISGVSASYPYAGNAITPGITVTDGSKTLVKNTDYTIEYTNNIDVGTATINVTGKGNYTGTVKKTFEIIPGTLTVEAVSDQTYTGSAITPDVVVKSGGKTLVKDTDYTVSYSNNINAGTATVTITGKGIYSDTKTVEFRINPKDISNFSVPNIATKVHTGSAIMPDAAVKDGDKRLVKGTDYTLSYTDNVDPGIATVTITGKGNYTGKAETRFAIRANGPAATAKAGDGEVTLTWSSVINATRYLVSVSDGTSTSTYNNNISGTSCTVKGLTNGTEYTFFVKAYSGGLWSTQGPTVSATPVANLILKATAGEGKITLSWNAVSGAVKYALTDVTGRSDVLISNKITSTSYTISNLTAGQTYSYFVKSYDGKKWSEASNTASATPKAPALTVKASAGEGKVTLTWNAPSGAVKYAVYDVTSGTGVLLSNKITATSYTVNNLTAGKTYSFSVRFYNGSKWSTASQTVSATPTAPAAPAITVKASAGEGKVTLTWNAPSGAVKYAVYDVTSGTGVLLSNKITATSYTVNNLTAGKTYSFNVRFYNGSKWSTASATVSATPTAPALTVTATAGAGQIKLSWNAVPNATKYAVTNVDGTIKTLISNKITTTSYVINNLTGGVKYSYYVQSFDGKKWSTASSTVSATPKASTVPVVTGKGGYGRVTLSWNAVPNATKYAVTRTDAAANIILSNKITDTTYSISGLDAGTYTYVVQSFNGKSWSAKSTPVTVTVT